MNAENINSLANWVLIVSLAVGLIATYFIVVSGNEKERKLRIELSKANVDSEKAKATAAIAAEQAAKANLKAAEVERQNIELRQKFANRRISEEQHEILVRELSKKPASFNFETMSDSASGLFAADIVRTLGDAGWKVDKKEFPIGEIWTGLLICNTNDPTASILADAFKTANIEFKIANKFKEEATILVGGKPPVF